MNILIINHIRFHEHEQTDQHFLTRNISIYIINIVNPVVTVTVDTNNVEIQQNYLTEQNTKCICLVILQCNY